jgi:hypothetical protein
MPEALTSFWFHLVIECPDLMMSYEICVDLWNFWLTSFTEPGYQYGLCALRLLDICVLYANIRCMVL